MKKVFWVLATLVGVFFIARAIAWPFTIDASDPATYASDWGGPSLIGAAAVHCGPGILAAILIVGAFLRGRRRARPSSVDSGRG